MAGFIDRVKCRRHVVIGMLEDKKKKEDNFYVPQKGAFIIGTGPSAKEAWDNVDKLKNIDDTDFVIFNEAVWKLYDKISILKPRVVILWDSAYFKPKRELVGQLKELIDVRNHIFANLKKVDWPLTLVIPKQFNIHLSNSNIRILKLRGYINQEPLDKNRFKYYDKNYLIPAGNNVMQISLYFSIMMRYKMVGFIGGEYSFWKDCFIDEKDGKSKVIIPHCYGTDDERLTIWTLEEDGNMYREGKTGPLPAFLRRTADSMDGFYYISEYARHRRVKITNYSNGSMIEAFDIEKFEKFLEGKNGLLYNKQIY